MAGPIATFYTLCTMTTPRLYTSRIMWESIWPWGEREAERERERESERATERLREGEIETEREEREMEKKGRIESANDSTKTRRGRMWKKERKKYGDRFAALLVCVYQYGSCINSNPADS